MSAGTQPHLPHTVPAPKLARENLARAISAVIAARATVATMKEARKVCRERMGDAEDERDTAAGDLADGGASASARYEHAVTELRDRRADLLGAKLAVREAREALKRAEKVREAADEDLIASAHGRRGDA